MQLLLAMEINWTTYNIFLSILIKKKSCPHSALLAWLMFVITHKDRAFKPHYFWYIFYEQIHKIV